VIKVQEPQGLQGDMFGAGRARSAYFQTVYVNLTKIIASGFSTT
jgi:hypothetical protein